MGFKMIFVTVLILVINGGDNIATGAQVDLVLAKRDQDARLQELHKQLHEAKAKGADTAEIEQQIEAVNKEDLWSKSDGTPAIELSQSESFHPFNFAILSDLHLSERQGPQRLARALQLINQRKDIAFVLVLGDIVWDKNPDKLKEIIAKAGVPVHLVYGNNDWKWVSDGSYEKAFGPRDYTFTYANCTFICMWDCLPMNHAENHKGDFSQEQWTWLERQLATAQDAGATHKFVAMHVPPQTPGAFNNLFFMFANTEDRFMKLLQQYHVTAGLFGHLHQAAAWERDGIKMYVNPSCCWNFISRTQKVDSSFVRIVKVEQETITDALLPVRLEHETFTWETLSKFYDPETHRK